MTIDVDIAHRLGGFELDAKFTSGGRLTALFGPSGSGKTSVINIIAGLLKPSKGRIVVDGRVLVDTSTRAYVPRHKRHVGYVFQDARLFPHLTVAQNLAYGRWFTKDSERYGDPARIVEMLGIGNLLERRPSGLSGGEKQRVAIGRALAASPRLLLMDEPLASLDEQRKAEILPYIETLRDEMRIPVIYVSHSIAEVARLATDIVVMDRGKAVANGPAAEVMLQSDLLPGEQRAEAGALIDMEVISTDATYDVTLLRGAAGAMRVPSLTAETGSIVRLRIRARDVMLALKRPDQISGLNVLSGKVAALGPAHGAHMDVTVDCGGQLLLARITRLSADTLALSPGKEVFAIVKSVSFDRTSLGATPLRAET